MSSTLNKQKSFLSFFSVSKSAVAGFFLCIIMLLCTVVSYAGTYKTPITQTLHLAQQGDINAQLELATAYDHGEGIQKNADEAIKWYCKAALKGSVDAQRSLAWMFFNARGVNMDEALAVRWFTAAAKSGDEFSQKMLSRLDEKAHTPKTVCVILPTPYWETEKCSKNCRQVVKTVKQIAPGYNMEARLVLALIQQESNFNYKARSHKGAIGLMQLLPTTAKRFGVKNINDPVQNIKGGIRYLSWLLKLYEGNVALALAGYNAGENAVDRYNGIPPYKETRNYVKRIMKVYGKKYHPYEKDVTMTTKNL